MQAIQFQGERIIVHADLGRIEHVESIDHVRKLAAFVKWPLLITKREKGDLLDRYEQRWHDNCRRYALLECVNLISPWPQPLARFCTGELKSGPITKALTTKYPGRTIISCAGIRAEESSARAKKPIFQPNPKFTRSCGTHGFDWHPIHSTTIEQVFRLHRKTGFPLHPQYLRGNSRLSCAFCFLASKNDLTAGAEVPTNHNSFRTIVDLEIRSSFSYQQNAWLADIKPELLTTETRQQLISAKQNGARRRIEEKIIPPELLFKNHGGRRGWPASQPTIEDCRLLANARREIANLFGDEIEQTTGTAVQYLTAADVYDRYADLLTERPPLPATNPVSRPFTPWLFSQAASV